MSAEQNRLLVDKDADGPAGAAEGQSSAAEGQSSAAEGQSGVGDNPTATPSALGSDYVVVARRYRPQSFDELVGQEHVARALTNAIAANRVGHAYLFTGARGVGKTSAARILAKALDCVHGPTATPCNQCDICLNVAVGSDVDVIEIDGASNRGIDEIRQLRQNVGVRPSRALFKIYIIDEVHMLTPQAFNALLKTLEEPPEHVKFIFCTTEANKIPITILSRCQRFDFAGIRAPSIRERLAQIAKAEGVEAEGAALELLARRANGSMRDSQSLLEQLLSFGGDVIRAADIHALLGTAGDERISQMIAHLAERNARGALAELDTAVREGVEVGQLLEQLMSVFRDAMTAAVGCAPDAFLYTSVESQESVAMAGRSLGLTTILAILQILDHALARMRYSTQSRTLAEMALVRIASLANLEAIGELLERLHEIDESANAERAAARTPGVASPAPPQGALAAPSNADVDLAKKKAALIPNASPASDDPPAAAATPSNGDARGASDATAAAAHPRASSPLDAAGQSPGGAPALHSQAVPDDSAPFSVGSNAAPERELPGMSDDEKDARPGEEISGELALATSGQETGDQGSARQGFEETGSTGQDFDPELAWRSALAHLPEGMLIAHAQHGRRIATFAPNRLVVYFPRRYNFSKSFCEQPERLAELRAVVAEAAGRMMQIEFVLEADEPVARAETPDPTQVAAGSRSWVAERTAHPLVAATVEAFGANVTRVDPPAG